MPDVLKDFFLHKLTLRLVYMISAYTTSHVVALCLNPGVQERLASIPGLTIKIQATDPKSFQVWLTGILLFCGEFIYHYLHDHFILPHIQTVEKIKNTEVKP